ncbi:PIN domain-containing protein [Panacagrimonas sp.]|uniref:PIN domain-containing protein n=1 Tax=Panacagrimonas sp. TaxID=2480088 RepID=UPI003B52000F
MRSFIDTNILVYADAGDEPVKQERALRLVAAARLSGEGVVSTQVLQEFANVALRKLRLPPGLVRERLKFYAGFEVVPVTADLIAAAVDLHASHQLALYDALIVRAAIAAGCARLWSEDMHDGLRFGGLQIANPFGVMAT